MAHSKLLRPLVTVTTLQGRRQTLEGEVAVLRTAQPWGTLVAFLRCLRGIDTVSALTLAAEVLDLRRVAAPRSSICFVGLLSREYSSGVPVHPRERVRYIISDADAPNAEARVRAIPFVAPDTPYDTGKYLELLSRAVETLLWHHGYDCRRLQAFLVERGIEASARH